MTITLYGDTLTSRSYRNAWMLKELELPYEYVPINAHNGGTHTPEFLKLNPNGRVPVLDDNGFLLFESMAINLYLARTYGGAMAGRDPREAALIEQWTFWVVTEIEKPLLWAAVNHKLFAPEQRNAEEAAAALKKLSRPFKVLEQQVAQRPYLVGDRFTAADLNVSTVLTLVPLCGIDISAYPAMAQWMERCLERPAAEDWKPISFSVPRPPTMLAMMQAFV